MQSMSRRQPLRQQRRSSPPNPWLPFVVTTDLDKSAPRLRPAVMVAVMLALASAERDRVLTVALHAVVTDLLTVRRVAISAKTVAPVWAMQPSVPNVRRWSAQKCRSANSQHKLMAKP
jgi:hypothetical protein